MTVLLDRRTVVLFYGACRQAERSLHRACDPANAWSKLQEYYGPAKRETLRQLQLRLHERMPAGHRTVPQDSSSRRRGPSLWRSLSSALLARWKKHWHFPEEEVGFFISTLEELLSVLCRSARPETELLISQRRQLVDCETIIEAHCVGVLELRQARAIAHFDQQPGHRGVEIEEFVPAKGSHL